jgi:hypothetical protein
MFRWLIEQRPYFRAVMMATQAPAMAPQWFYQPV